MSTKVWDQSSVQYEDFTTLKIRVKEIPGTNWSKTLSVAPNILWAFFYVLYPHKIDGKLTAHRSNFAMQIAVSAEKTKLPFV
jgi:hypothetical protein